MKAKIEPRINLENRTKLEEVIPLSIPFILFIDPSSMCTFKCNFCPTGNTNLIKQTKRWQGQMDFDLYKKIIDDLSQFDKSLKVLRLYKEGEPLINKDFSGMIKYAKDSNYVQNIDTTTNGYLLTSELSQSILESGIDRINISVNGMNEKQFLAFSGVNINFDEYVKNITNLYKIKEDNGYDCEICIKIIGDFLTNQQKKQFFDTFGDYSDRIFIEKLSPCWPEFDVERESETKISDTKGIYDQPLPENDVSICPYIFYSTTVNSDGTVSLCFLDWAHKLIIGDIKNQSLKEIWFGNELFQYQINYLQGKRKENPICSKCGQLTHCLPDNIDSYAEILTEKLLSRENARRKS